MEKRAREVSMKSGSASAERPRRKPRRKVLSMASRGIPPRFRHLVQDLSALLPHVKKEPKIESNKSVALINEICDLHGCSVAMFFECRKKQDLYLWIGRVPNGPTIRFQVLNVHTMAELKLSGNALKGSRFLCTFGPEFNEAPLLRLAKVLLTEGFAVPNGHPKGKPFIDHTLHFAFEDDVIWMRHYQIDTQNKDKDGGPSLTEIGPRLVLEPIRVFEGSYSGPALFAKADFVTPSQIRASTKARAATVTASRLAKRKRHREAEPMHVDDHLEEMFDLKQARNG